MGAFLNSTAKCETVECFQAATQFLDDNLLDVMSHVVGAQLGMEPVMLVRCLAGSLGLLDVSRNHRMAC